MDIAKIRALTFAPVVQSYDAKDAILYALGLGYGSAPREEAELRFVYEGALACVPSYANVLSGPGFWEQDPHYGIDWRRIVHGEQQFTIHSPLPPTGTVRGESAIVAVEDKGGGRGAVVHMARELFDHATGAHLATVRYTHFLRADGGHGGFGEPLSLSEVVPDRAPDRVIEVPTLPQQALIYRLSGDWNPLHADPAAAREVGFERPILHGLCTKGIVGRALLGAYGGHEAARFRSMAVRFSSPFMPGDRIRIEIFEEAGGLLRFRALSSESGAVVLDRGSATIL